MDPDVVLVDLPDAHVRSVRRRLSLDALPAFAREHLAGGTGTPWLVFHAPVTPDADGDVEACVPCDAGVPGAERRPGGRFAAATVQGDDARPPRLLAVYEQVAASARAQGLRLAGPPRERYLDGGRVQVAWPVEEPVTGG